MASNHAPTAAPCQVAVLAPLAAPLVEVADHRRARAARQLDSILSQLSAGGGRVGRWAQRLQQDDADADYLMACRVEAGR